MSGVLLPHAHAVQLIDRAQHAMIFASAEGELSRFSTRAREDVLADKSRIAQLQDMARFAEAQGGELNLSLEDISLLRRYAE